jgi:hypothetical protein
MFYKHVIGYLIFTVNFYLNKLMPW